MVLETVIGCLYGYTILKGVSSAIDHEYKHIMNVRKHQRNKKSTKNYKNKK